MMEAQERTEDGTKPALRVRSLVEVEAFKRRCSDRLLNMPRVDEVTDDLYNVCCVLPQNPTDEQLGDLAFRLSNFLEDAHRLHVDHRGASGSPLGALAPPMSLPIVNRARLREAQTVVVNKRVALQVGGWPACVANISERETICMLYLNVSKWDGWPRFAQLGKLDLLAVEHGLRCVDVGRIPQD